MDMTNAGNSPRQPQISTETIKNAQLITCPCGGTMFTEKLMFKSISAILSPSGKQETIPMPIVVCEDCGKIPNVFDPLNLIPKKYKAVELEEEKHKDEK